LFIFAVETEARIPAPFPSAEGRQAKPRAAVLRRCGVRVSGFFSPARIRRVSPALLLLSAVVTWAGFDCSGAGSHREPAEAFRSGDEGFWIEGVGVVERILSDDDRGIRHQRFVLRLDSGQTLLVAHNTDLAPAVAPLAEGDTVRFRGEYRWNREGGVIHWTHHDPSGNAPGGWLIHRGAVYR